MKHGKTKTWRWTLALLAALVLAGGWPTGTIWAATREQVDEVRQILKDYHISKPDDAELNQAAIDAMVDSLHDQYTEYFDPEEWKTFSSELEQQFTGIGIVLVEEDGTVYIEDVLPDSPAEAAGIQPGDAVISADGQSMKGLSVSEVQQKLRGKEGTSVMLGVSRDGKPLDFTLVRKSIQLRVAKGQTMGDGVGYLALSGFTSDAGSLFTKKLEELEKTGIQSLVIDLRNNGGGYVSAAQQIASLFVKDGVLAHLKDRDGKDTPVPISGGGKSYPVTILVNGYTASASELLSGALQDYGIARLVGTKTFGKGVVQTIIPLNSGGVIKVTVQEYFTPKGRAVDKKGLTPDHVIEGESAQLIGAYLDAGGKSLSLAIGKGSVLVNGVRTAYANAAVQQGGKWYVQLRMLAAMVGAQATYDGKTKTVVLSRGTQTYRLNSGDSRLTNRQGWSLIDLAVFRSWFPELTSDTSGGQLKLSVQ